MPQPRGPGLIFEPGFEKIYIKIERIIAFGLRELTSITRRSFLARF
jgi:hypothetical protein